MNKHQKNTYLVYGRGIDPNRLKLGSLFLDPANPQERSPFIFNLESKDLETWTGSPERDAPCSLEFTASRGWLASFNLLSLVDGNSSHDSGRHLRVEGKSGVRYQLNEPEQFLNDVVLASSKARDWLVPRLSISRRMYYLDKVVGKAPKVWMLTGVQLISQGSVNFTQGSATSTGGGFTVPVPEPVTGTALAAAGTGAVSGQADVHAQTDSESVYGYKGSRVWAAQFMKLNVGIRGEVSTVDVGGARAGNWVKLRPLEDIKKDGVREDEDDDQPAEYIDLQHIGVSGASEGVGIELCENALTVDWALLDDYLDYIASVPNDE